MSDNDVTQVQDALLRVLEEQERRNPRSTPKAERWFTQGVMMVTLFVVAFVGNTVWENALAIGKIQEQVATLHQNMLDRFTGKDGVALNKRLMIVERDHHIVIDGMNSLISRINSLEIKIELMTTKAESDLVHEKLKGKIKELKSKK